MAETFTARVRSEDNKNCAGRSGAMVASSAEGVCKVARQMATFAGQPPVRGVAFSRATTEGMEEDEWWR